ncbi:MAG: hypothetical protein KKA62_03835 [Nanoarchaeota archaeon]|nr:hypothetical protein [Nanoarchaeota archaeon]MBU1643785.1 hypothetical protein [Nanoarchaeota archaeon]MBU1977056.1 hypothetical protein [Nanoarchaeota archaeon]
MVRSIEGKNLAYYEAIFQLRKVSPEVILFAREKIEKAGVHIAKEVRNKNGLDFYLSDNNFARALGKRLQEKFGGECTITASIFGRKSGKEIYRLTVLFRGISFQKGDIVEYLGSNYKVKLLGKDIFLQEVKIGKKVHVKYKDMDSVNLVS